MWELRTGERELRGKGELRGRVGALRGRVWHSCQLHGDTGARLRLAHKITSTQFRDLLEDPKSEACKAKKGAKDDQIWCLGDVCPHGYQFPQWWDNLGELPPTKDRKSGPLNETICICQRRCKKYTKRSKRVPDVFAKPLDPNYNPSTTPASSSISPLTNPRTMPSPKASTGRRLPKFPKSRIPIGESNG